jgi:ATP-dependent DNA helicase RecG
VARLLPLCQTPESRDALMQQLGLGHREHFRKAYLLPALESGMLERTIPDKPQSSKQRYRLTAKGHEWLRLQGRS